MLPTCDCGKCAKCKARERNRKWRAVNPDGHRSACARWTAKNPHRPSMKEFSRARRERDRESSRQEARERYAQNRERIRATAAAQRDRDRVSGALAARQAVRIALREGEMVRPSTCEECGAPDLPLADGRTSLHAHHDDFARPLDVVWCCTICHGLTRRATA